MDDALEDALSIDAGGHQDDEVFETAVRRCIPSEFLLIASQDDLSKAQEAYHAAKLFNLPNAKGDAGSVATSAFLQLLYKNPDMAVAVLGEKPTSCLEMLQELHLLMKKATTFVVNPQISSSRPLGPPRLGQVYAPFHIVPDGYTGKRRALLIGIRFMDDIESQQLKGPHNDVYNVKQYLEKACGFEQQDIQILADDSEHTAPTKQHILDSFTKMTETVEPGDVVFIQYSGHGGRVKDMSGDKDDGYDSYILPSDYKAEGQILDDDILRDLIKAMPNGVYTTLLVDCCNSGTVGDLPYVIKANTERDQEIERYFDTDTRTEILEKEAQADREKEEYKHAKVERKKQRELRKQQQEEEYTAAKRKAEEDAQRVVGQVIRSQSPTRVQHTTAPVVSAAPPTTQNFVIKDESEVEALSKQFGATLALLPEQKACLELGGTVTLSFSLQQAVAQPPVAMVQSGTVMMAPEEAGASKEAKWQFDDEP